MNTWLFRTYFLWLKGHCHGLTCAEFKSAQTHAATETYKYWSSFDKNYNASVMKLKKVLSLWYHQELKIRTWKNQPDFSSFATVTVSL